MSTGLSGLMAFQRAIDVTGHNIANANTTGYTRQGLSLGTRPASPYSNGWVGNGVDVLTVRRSYDAFLTATARSADNSASQLDLFAAQAERLNNLFGNADTGIAAQFQKFQNAIQGVSAAPTSQAARQVLLGEARATVAGLQGYDEQLRQSNDSVNSQVTADVTDINGIASGIAQLNQAIAVGQGSTGQPPNDLLDQRDSLLNQLAKKISVSVVPQDNGTLNVFVGNGQSLVLGETASKLTVRPGSFDATQPIVSIGSGAASVDITGALTGGTLGGALAFRSQMLDPARNALGRIAAGFAAAVNTQHHSGMDLNGALGADFFSVGGPKVTGASTNTGTGTIGVSRSNVAALQDTDYVLQKTAGGWNLTRADSGAAVAMSGTGTNVDPFIANGVDVTVGGAAATGDRFLIQPTREVVAGMTVNISSPSAIAAATPIRATANVANTGQATTTLGEVLDPSNPQLRQPVTLQFLTANTYSINGAGNFAYTSGQPIDLNGWRVAISGAPAVGDRFNIQDNASGTGDNRNALALAAAMNKPLLDGGTASLTQAVGGFVGQIGQATHEAQVNRDAQVAVRDEAVTSRDNSQGVNLNEEAANLLRYQQAYQAMSQVIRVAGTMFDTLLNATR
jgi:flagellar hook-associated protein 1 FlgK